MSSAIIAPTPFRKRSSYWRLGQRRRLHLQMLAQTAFIKHLAGYRISDPDQAHAAQLKRRRMSKRCLGIRQGDAWLEAQAWARRRIDHETHVTPRLKKTAAQDILGGGNLVRPFWAQP
jgi:hypothetical protein